MLNKGIRSELGAETPIYSFSDEQTRKKIRRHYMDINDIITDRDIKDAKVPGIEEKGKQNKKEKKAAKKATATTSRKTRKAADDTPGNPATPWDIVEE